MLVLHDVTQERRSRRMLQRQHEGMRLRAVKFLDELSSNPFLEASILEVEEVGQETRQCLAVGLLFREVAVEPHYMAYIALLGELVEMAREASEVSRNKRLPTKGTLGQPGNPA